MPRPQLSLLSSCLKSYEGSIDFVIEIFELLLKSVEEMIVCASKRLENLSSWGLNNMVSLPIFFFHFVSLFFFFFTCSVVAPNVISDMRYICLMNLRRPHIIIA